MVDVVAEPDMTFGGKIPCDEVYLSSSSVRFFGCLFCLFFFFFFALLLT